MYSSSWETKITMFKYLSILILLLSLASIQEVHAQKSAKAVMDITVQVVKGANVEANHQNSVTLEQSGETSIGSIAFGGDVDGMTITTYSDEIALEDTKGETIYFSVNRNKISGTKKSSGISLYNSSNKPLQNGLYKGNLTTTIAYN